MPKYSLNPQIKIYIRQNNYTCILMEISREISPDIRKRKEVELSCCVPPATAPLIAFCGFCCKPPQDGCGGNNKAACHPPCH